MPCSKQKAGHFGRLVTLMVVEDGGGVGGHEDAVDETGDGDVVKFLCLQTAVPRTPMPILPNPL